MQRNSSQFLLIVSLTRTTYHMVCVKSATLRQNLSRFRFEVPDRTLAIALTGHRPLWHRLLTAIQTGTTVCTGSQSIGAKLCTVLVDVVTLQRNHMIVFTGRDTSGNNATFASDDTVLHMKTSCLLHAPKMPPHINPINPEFPIRSVLKSFVIAGEIQSNQHSLIPSMSERQLVAEQTRGGINVTKHSPYSSPQLRQICHNQAIQLTSVLRRASRPAFTFPPARSYSSKCTFTASQSSSRTASPRPACCQPEPAL